MSLQYTEAVVAIAIGVLTIIFIGALFVLVIICRKQRLYFRNLCDNQQDDIRPDVLLIGRKKSEKSEVELGDIRMNAELEQVLADEQWIDDATGLVPHCIALLKICHTLTERLTAFAMAPLHSTAINLQIGDIARKISNHVDDVVRSMYPPLDPRLLEARAAALSLAVAHLALITRYEFGLRHKHATTMYIDRALAEMDTHLLVLRDAALSQEAATRIQNVILSSNTSVLEKEI